MAFMHLFLLRGGWKGRRLRAGLAQEWSSPPLQLFVLGRLRLHLGIFTSQLPQCQPE